MTSAAGPAPVPQAVPHGPLLVIQDRQPLPVLRFNVLVGLAATSVAAASYLAFLSVRTLPNPSVATIMFALSPIAALLALPVFINRARAERDNGIAWFSAGLALAALTLILQFISLPSIIGGRGPFGTNDQSNALLYLLFHGALICGVLGGAFNIALIWRRLFLGVGVVLGVLAAVNLVPAPQFLGPDGEFTQAVDVAQWMAAGGLTISLVFWVRASGRFSTPLRGWVSLALLLLAYEVVLNALSTGRFDAVWWASLTMRVSAFMVLAIGATFTLLQKLTRLEGYSERELRRSESQLEESVSISENLLSVANALTRAPLPQDVAELIGRSLQEALSVRQLVVLDADTSNGGLRLLYREGEDLGSLQVTTPELREVLLQPDAEFVMGAESKDHQALQRLGVAPSRSFFARLPLRAGGSTIGAVVASGQQERTWSPWTRELVLGIAAQGGPALSRARLYEREHANAEALQRALLPERLPEVVGIDIAAHYEVGAEGISVGGDWYDCIALSDGQVALVVGDVMGKGIEAASVMGRLRDATRVLVGVDPSPTAVLQGLNDVLIDAGSERIATVAYLLLNPAAGTARIARAGHPPPVLVRKGGAAELIGDVGLSPLLGLPVDERGEDTFSVASGSTIVLYTDGLVETRDGLQPGTERLVGVAATVCRAESPMSTVLDQLMIGLRDNVRRDDVAVLLVRVTD
ncbi:MAG: GAF domain-containing SpoIIE family protein phosphatase [Actinomycetes bacterium]